MFSPQQSQSGADEERKLRFAFKVVVSGLLFTVAYFEISRVLQRIGHGSHASRHASEPQAELPRVYIPLPPLKDNRTALLFRRYQRPFTGSFRPPQRAASAAAAQERLQQQSLQAAAAAALGQWRGWGQARGRRLLIDSRVYSSYMTSALARGAWYWGRGNKKPSNWTHPSACYAREEGGGNDFHTPLKGRFEVWKRPLPMYNVEHPVLARHQCWNTGGRGHAPLSVDDDDDDEYMPWYSCGAADSPKMQSNLRLFWRGNCSLMPLHHDYVLHTLPGSKLWFVGDYTMYQQWEHLKCSLADFMPSKGRQRQQKPRTERGSRGIVTGTRPECFTARAPRRPLLTACYIYTGPLEHKAGARWVELADVVRERLEEFQPQDVLLAGMGLHYQDPTLLHLAVSTFLQLFKLHASRLPLLLWRESLAQHHRPINASLATLQQSLPGGYVSGMLVANESAAGPANASTGNWGSELVSDGRLWAAKMEVAAGHPHVLPQAFSASRGVPQADVNLNLLSCAPVPIEEQVRHNWRNTVANTLMDNAGVPILRVWQASLEFHDQYDSGKCRAPYCRDWGPCMYYCRPTGMLLLMNEVLFSMLRSPPLQKPLMLRKTPPSADASASTTPWAASADVASAHDTSDAAASAANDIGASIETPVGDDPHASASASPTSSASGSADTTPPLATTSTTSPASSVDAAEAGSVAAAAQAGAPML